jgi:calcineurin-like phosphoesterase family protein
MTSVWYTADTHFTHRMVAELRGFASSAGHDEVIVANWNAVVGRDDTVWHLGDVGLGKPALILPWAARLNGAIHLITGNHDAVWPGHRDSHKHQREWLEHFASVQSFARRKIGGRYVLLSHFPYDGDHTAEDRHRQFRLRDEGTWLLHGHTHGRERLGQVTLPPVTFGGEGAWRGRQLHVGLDAWDLRPVPQCEVERLIAERTALETAAPDMPYLTPLDLSAMNR